MIYITKDRGLGGKSHRSLLILQGKQYNIQNPKETYDLTIVGGGIVGLASAYAIQRKFPDLRIAIIEKEDRLAAHQTGHNSGVLHSGIYYQPGSLKARLCKKGREQIVAFARAKNIPHNVCGKVIVATGQEEIPRLKQILETGKENKLEHLQWLDAAQIRHHEPHCQGLAGIYVPQSGIIDYPAVAEKLAEEIKYINPESALLLATEVTDIQTADRQSTVLTNRGTFITQKTIFCGGLFADRLAALDGIELPERIVGFRGDYYELTQSAAHKVRNLIYPVPDPVFPFLGVHFTRMVRGGIECGPNAVFTFKREGYGKTDFDWQDTRAALSYKGTWKLFRKNWQFGLKEYHRAFSKKRFLETLQRLIPDLEMGDIRPGRSGVRAVLLTPEGDTKSDFRIERGENSIHVLNAPSPAATASLAIGDEVCRMAVKEFKW